MLKRLFLLFLLLNMSLSLAYSDDSFSSYLSKFNSFDFPVIHRCNPSTKYGVQIDTSELKRVFGFPAEELTFVDIEYDFEQGTHLNEANVAVDAYVLGYCSFNDFFVVLLYVNRHYRFEDDQSKTICYVFKKDGAIVDQFLFDKLLISEQIFYYSILTDENNIISFDYKCNFEYDEEDVKKMLDPSKTDFFVAVKKIKIGKDGKFQQYSSYEINLERQLSHYFDCPIPEDDPMYEYSKK